MVTGAAGTMGRAVMDCLAQDQIKTVGIDVKASPNGIVCDITDPEAVRKAIREIGQVDILVNNAGILSNNKPSDRARRNGTRSGRRTSTARSTLRARSFPDEGAPLGTHRQHLLASPPSRRC